MYGWGCGPCSPLSAYPASQRGYYEEPEKYELFFSSFLRGGAYTLLPELFRDVLEFRGYSRASNVVATIIQGGIIAYNTSSYAPAAAGILVKTGLNKLGFSERSSTIAGSTAAVIASLSQKLIFSSESVLDCVVDVTIGVAGSYAGSILALKAKSWVYNFCGFNDYTLCENIQ
ncbi:MAG: hypothetical protein KBD36_05620 [Alphaproteobacteria bacterium]|nr:hypothetical protein [Alphaproteobacteria bacterium]MBP9777303.1 hypothetical protein [Alphaproteobacteria bacterium]